MPCAITSLLYEHQVAAIKDVYNGTIDMKAISTKYPSLSHHK